MSIRHFTAAPDDAELDMEPKTTPQSAPTYHIDDLDEPMENIVNALIKMGIYSPPGDSDVGNDEMAQGVPKATSNVVSRVTDTEDALAELVRVSFIHTHMLMDLQAANAALSEQLEATTVRLDQMQVEFHALRDAHSTRFLSNDNFNLRETTFDGQSFMVSPAGHQHSVINRFVTHPVPGYDSSDWMDMSDIATTLAVAPQITSSASWASSQSSSSSFRERRQSKPHRYATPLPQPSSDGDIKADASDREEHVKRSRITYDGNGGQTPNILPPDITSTGDLDEERQPSSSDGSSMQSAKESMSSGEDGGPSEPSLTSWLYGKAAKMLFRQ